MKRYFIALFASIIMYLVAGCSSTLIWNDISDNGKVTNTSVTVTEESDGVAEALSSIWNNSNPVDNLFKLDDKLGDVLTDDPADVKDDPADVKDDPADVKDDPADVKDDPADVKLSEDYHHVMKLGTGGYNKGMIIMFNEDSPRYSQCYFIKNGISKTLKNVESGGDGDNNRQFFNGKFGAVEGPAVVKCTQKDGDNVSFNFPVFEGNKYPKITH